MQYKYICLFSIISLSLLSGCTGIGPLVPTQTMDKTGIKTVLVAAQMKVVSSEEAATMQNLGQVVGYSCKNKNNDIDATEVGASDQAKIVAAQRGATAITNLVCEEGGFSLIRNCWHSWECKGIALR